MPIEIRWEDLIKLNFVTDDDLSKSLKSVVSRLKKEKVITAYRPESGLFAFKQTSQGKCRYLKENKCSIYKIRPLVCREFPIRMGWRHGFCPKTTPVELSPT
jgi:Fe-S-cluster containining protein